MTYNRHCSYRPVVACAVTVGGRMGNFNTMLSELETFEWNWRWPGQVSLYYFPIFNEFWLSNQFCIKCTEGLIIRIPNILFPSCEGPNLWGMNMCKFPTLMRIKFVGNKVFKQKIVSVNFLACTVPNYWSIHKISYAHGDHISLYCPTRPYAGL
jgi:hypothetical protein